MAELDPNVTAILLARGLLELHERVITDGGVVQQDADMPTGLRRALALLSGLCLREGAEDLGASLHVAMDQACEPFSVWGVAAFRAPFPFSDVALIDREVGMPTPDCRELAALGGSELAVQEDIHHTMLRATVQAFPIRQRERSYTSIREFIVRHPAVAYADRERFVVEGGLVAAARTIASFYRPVPMAALVDGVARLCGYCGSLLWPDRDIAAYPHGRCRIRQCRLAHPQSARGDEITNPSEWQLATAAALAYWVGPGLDEIRIYDALIAAGRDTVLYPAADAADVGVDGFEIGIDVKAYASPVVLAAKLSRSIGRFDSFRRRILAVPDDKLRLNTRYLEQLRDVYSGAHRLEFMTASQAIGTLT
jgi:REase associating with pPIWI_RE/pPIWI_RE three-gene island domain Y